MRIRLSRRASGETDKKQSRFILAAAAMVALFGLLLLQSEFVTPANADTIGSPASMEDARLDMASAYLTGIIPSEFGGALREPVANGKFKLEDLEKVVFLLPGDTGYQPESPYNYFALIEKQGQRGQRMVDAYLKYGYFVPPKFLENVTNKKNTKLKFNLWRVETEKYIDDILFAIVPDVLPIVCERGYYGTKTYEPPAAINAPEDNSQLIKAPETFRPREAEGGMWQSICIKNDARWDLFISMGGRFKIKSQDKWQIR